MKTWLLFVTEDCYVAADDIAFPVQYDGEDADVKGSDVDEEVYDDLNNDFDNDCDNLIDDDDPPRCEFRFIV